MKNPYLNAVVAALYIVGIVLVINAVSAPDTPDNTIFAPIAAVSLFTLSAAVMGGLFVYRPARMFLEGQKNEAATFFIKTVLTFACFVALFVILLFLRS